MDFLYSSHGWKNEKDPENTINLNYIQISPMLKIGFFDWSDIYAQTGLYLGCAVSGKNDGQKIQFGREYDRMRAFDFGGIFELGLQYEKIQIGLGYQFGFANLSNVKKTYERNTSLMMNATYLFGNHPVLHNENYFDPIEIYWDIRDSNNRAIGLHASLPSINFFRMTPENEGTKIRTGFFGVSIGFDYYHSKFQFINLGFTYIEGNSKRTKISNPPAPFTSLKEIESMNSKYFTLSNNHKIRRLSIGYGLSYAINNWIYYKSGWFNFLFFFHTNILLVLTLHGKSG